ncbi:hypothetical protein JW916_06925 [Candidatus Sumerlaeota bacterium]|nr:hypothetical protein [Candidatus Sumerlaeota bacterium]
MWRAALSVVAVAHLLLAGSVARADDFALLIGGQGGEEPYRTEFVRTLASVRKQMVENQAYPASNTCFLAEKADGDYPVDAPPTLENIRAEFARLRTEVGTSDTLLLVVLGHGQSDHVEAKLNLPGPDLSALELRAMLDSVPAGDQRLILIFPCSGHFAQVLSARGRAILSSCAGSREIYHSVAAPFLVQAFQGFLADADRDGETTLYEVFEFLSQETPDFYESLGLLQAEHPSLDDDGDRSLSSLREGKPTSRDGKRAKALRLLPAPGGKGAKPPTNESVGARQGYGE